MSNMRYCKYRNTLLDLQDCYNEMDNVPDGELEIKARKLLIALCKDIAIEHNDEV